MEKNILEKENPRLQKALAAAGVASRRACEALIAEGRVTVNGKVVREMGSKVNPATDDIRVDGDPIAMQEKPRPLYIMLHKPVGYASTVSDPHADKTVLELLAQITDRVYPVGRLDADSDGLLLLTNDGEFANRVTHPRYHVPKLYRVRARGFVDREAATHLAEGVQLEDGMTAPATVRYIEFDAATQTTLIEITLFEGRNRQVRRMFDLVGHPVRQLTRVGFGSLRLAGLNSGTWRKLRPEEVDALLDLAQPTPTPPKEARRAKPAGPYRPRNAGNIARQNEEAAARQGLEAAPAPVIAPRPVPLAAPLTQSQTLDRLAAANNSFVPRNAFMARTPGIPAPAPPQERGGAFRPPNRKPRPAPRPHTPDAQADTRDFDNDRPGAARPAPLNGSAPMRPSADGRTFARPQSRYQSAAPQPVRPATPFERKLLMQARASNPRPTGGNGPMSGASGAAKFSPPQGGEGQYGAGRPTPRPVYGANNSNGSGNGGGQRPAYGGNNTSRPAYGNGGGNAPRPPYGGDAPQPRPAFGNNAPRPVSGNGGNRPRPAYGNDNAPRPAYGNTPQSRPGNGPQPRPTYGSGPQSRPAYGNGGGGYDRNGNGGGSRPAFGNSPQSRPAYGNAPQSRPGASGGQQGRPAFGNAPGRKPGGNAPRLPAPDGSTNNAEGRKAGIPYVARPRSGHAKFGRAKP